MAASLVHLGYCARDAPGEGPTRSIPETGSRSQAGQWLKRKEDGSLRAGPGVTGQAEARGVLEERFGALDEVQSLHAAVGARVRLRPVSPLARVRLVARNRP